MSVAKRVRTSAPEQPGTRSLEPQSESDSTAQTGQALSNHLILKEIFQNLAYKDLVSCCNVNELWKEVAAPMICFFRIDLTLSDSVPNCRATVEEINEFPGVPQKTTLTLDGLVSKLRKCAKKGLMSIELRISGGQWTSLRTGLDATSSFFSDFGHRVHVLVYETRASHVGLKKFSSTLSFLPNLQEISSDTLQLLPNDGRNGRAGLTADDTFERRPLPQLRRINFGKGVGSLLWDYVLDIAPNVKEIWGFPIELSEFLLRFSSAVTVRSLIGYDPPENRSWYEFERNLKILGNNDMKLVAASIPNFSQGRSTVERWNPNSELAKTIQSSFCRILESSKDSLEVLSISPARYLNYFFPIGFHMSSLKTLKFEDNEAFAYSCNNNSGTSDVLQEEYRYFPPGTDLKIIFPKIEKIEINFKHLTHSVTKFFPWETFGPTMLGTNLTELKTSILSSYVELATLFPHVKHLEMQSTVDHFGSVFPEICTGWPGLESLIVNIVSQESFHRYPKEAYYNLDSALTGIPENVCAKLWRYKSENLLKEVERDSVSLLNMSSLTLLKVTVENSGLVCRLCGMYHLQNIITPVGLKYALERLPNLKVSGLSVKPRTIVMFPLSGRYTPQCVFW